MRYGKRRIASSKWISPRELHFIPTKALKENQVYRISLQLKNLVPETKEENPTFNVTVKGQKFWFGHKALHINADGSSTIEGNINTTYPVSLETAKLLLTAKQEQQSLPISWEQSSSSEYRFTIQAIKRQQESSNVQLSFSGKALDIDESYTRNVHG